MNTTPRRFGPGRQLHRECAVALLSELSVPRQKKKVVFFSFSATVNQLINDGVERLPRTSFAVVFRCCFSVWNATLPSETQLFGSLTFSSAVVFVILPFRNSHRAREFEAESGSLFYKKKNKTNKQTLRLDRSTAVPAFELTRPHCFFLFILFLVKCSFCAAAS